MLVHAESLSKRYGSVAALDDCSFKVEAGEIVGLLGPNGAGKTTLLRLLMGYMRPSSGRALIDGFDCYRQSINVHQRVSYLPGDARLPRHLRGGQTLSFYSRLRRDATSTKAIQLAEYLQLDLSRRVGQMSTGMRQKLALVIALAPGVPLLILDEPTSNLDPTVRREIVQMIRRVRSDGCTVLFSSHILSEVEQVCDRVLLLRQGRLVDDLRMSDVRQQHRITAKLTRPLAPLPQDLAVEPVIAHGPNNHVTLLTPGDLAPLLGWLSEQGLAELRVEPLGLAARYEQHHPASAT